MNVLDVQSPNASSSQPGCGSFAAVWTIVIASVGVPGYLAGWSWEWFGAFPITVPVAGLLALGLVRRQYTGAWVLTLIVVGVSALVATWVGARLPWGIGLRSLGAAVLCVILAPLMGRLEDSVHGLTTPQALIMVAASIGFIGWSWWGLLAGSATGLVLAVLMVAVFLLRSGAEETAG